RRVRANSATAHVTRLSAAIAARDADALPALIADDSVTVHHPTGSDYGRQGLLRLWRAQIEGGGGAMGFQTLGTLGGFVAPCRQRITGSGATGEKFDIGAYEVELFVLVEADNQGRRRRTEVFAADRLGDAIVRLYERHAELLPAGPARDRPAITARSVE